MNVPPPSRPCVCNNGSFPNGSRSLASIGASMYSFLESCVRANSQAVYACLSSNYDCPLTRFIAILCKWSRGFSRSQSNCFLLFTETLKRFWMPYKHRLLLAAYWKHNQLAECLPVSCRLLFFPFEWQVGTYTASFFYFCKLSEPLFPPITAI